MEQNQRFLLVFEISMGFRETRASSRIPIGRCVGAAVADQDFIKKKIKSKKHLDNWDLILPREILSNATKTCVFSGWAPNLSIQHGKSTRIAAKNMEFDAILWVCFQAGIDGTSVRSIPPLVVSDADDALGYAMVETFNGQPLLLPSTVRDDPALSIALKSPASAHGNASLLKGIVDSMFQASFLESIAEVGASKDSEPSFAKPRSSI